MDEYLGEPGVRRHFQHGVDMIFVTVNPAGRQEPHDVQRAVVLLGLLYGIQERWVAVKAFILNC